MEEVLPIVIFLIIILAGGLKKLIRFLAHVSGPIEPQEGQLEEGEFKANRQTIRDFLAEIGAKRQAPPVQQALPESEVVQTAMPEHPVELEAVEFGPLPPAPPVEVAPPRKQRPAPRQREPRVASPFAPLTVERPREKARKRRPRRGPKERAIAEAERPPKTAGKGGAGIGALKSGVWHIRKAVIWSEILGTPVSLRRRPGHRPPSERR